MADPATVAVLLSSNLVQNVFQVVLKNRSALMKDIKVKVKGSDADLKIAVKKLQDADLISAREASIPDFNSYYVTANGLGAEKLLREVGQAQA